MSGYRRIMLYRLLTEHFQTLAVELKDSDPELAQR